MIDMQRHFLPGGNPAGVAKITEKIAGFLQSARFWCLCAPMAYGWAAKHAGRSLIGGAA